MFASRGRDVRHEMVVDSPVEDIWPLVSSNEGLASFFAPEAEIDLTTGGRFHLAFRPGATKLPHATEGSEILDWFFMGYLSLSWYVAVGNLKSEATHVTISLDPLMGGKTRIEIVQDHFGDGPEWDKAFGIAVRAWEPILDRLYTRTVYGSADMSNVTPFWES